VLEEGGCKAVEVHAYEQMDRKGRENAWFRADVALMRHILAPETKSLVGHIPALKKLDGRGRGKGKGNDLHAVARSGAGQVERVSLDSILRQWQNSIFRQQDGHLHSSVVALNIELQTNCCAGHMTQGSRSA
jgi:hypothetical protein